MSCRCATAADDRGPAGLALAHEEVQQQQVGVDAVALGEVHAEAVAARLLAAHHGPGLDHPGPHELEAHRGLVDGHAVTLAEAERPWRSR